MLRVGFVESQCVAPSALCRPVATFTTGPFMNAGVGWSFHFA
jgi:hypothetical protein